MLQGLFYLSGSVENMVKKIGIVSLSSGILGDSFIEYELKIGMERLNKYGIELEFLPNALKGIDFIKITLKAERRIC